jgi:hypothetical protein
MPSHRSSSRFGVCDAPRDNITDHIFMQLDIHPQDEPTLETLNLNSTKLPSLEHCYKLISSIEDLAAT